MAVIIYNRDGLPEESDGMLFESGNKVFLIEEGYYNGKQYVEARELYARDGHFGRTQKAARIQIEDVIEFIADLIQVSGIPFTLENINQEDTAIAEGLR